MKLSEQIVNQVVVGAIALVLIVGTVGLLFTGHAVPEFMVGFDGVVVTAAFANGAFFVQARAATPTALALKDAHDMIRTLAVGNAATTLPVSTTESTTMETSSR